MKKLKYIEYFLTAVLIIIILIIAGYLIFNFVIKKDNSNKKPVLTNEIKEYGYTCNSLSTQLYKDTFKELSKELSKKDINSDIYAKLVSQLFIIDFYTLNNKPTKNDVGGVQFIHKEEKENFILKATDTMYKYIENNLDENRKQKLPIVKNIQVTNISNISYKYGNKTDSNAYKIDLSWEYKEDLGYENSATLILIHDENKLSIVEKSEKEA